MGNCCSDDRGGRAAIGGTPADIALGNGNDAPDDAVHLYLRSRGYHGLYSQIQLSFSASGLRDRDVLSKSDPMLVVYTRGRDGVLKEVGRTEVVLNSLNPKWINTLNVTFQFEIVQTMSFRLYDVDTQFHQMEVKMLKLEEQQFLGEASCALSEDPFLVISKIVDSGIPIPVCKTEVIRNDLKPTWKPVFLNIQQVGSKDSPLVIECFNFNSSGKHDLIGKLRKSLLDLEKLHSSGKGENLVLPTAAGDKVLKSQLFVDTFSESTQDTFLDYLAAGFEVNFMLAVDFTASNGNPRLPDSLHYIDPSGRPNAYQRAILEVGEVLQFYDSDRRFPAWGFGARPIDGPVSHCFNLNGSSTYCEVEGIQGIMMAYTSALLNVSLAGPTLFGPVISNAAQIAGQSLANGRHRYFVLLIITDGVVTDLQETKDALVKASDLPLSILIVGVGGADFKEMEVLDADKGERLESSNGRVATRDIVQFVPFRDIQSGGISVVQELLAELPTQFLTYMRSRGIKPSC
ncbi:hypothetical protein BT93_K2494 [Corymbia citriodora subsp. variegata]|nr:hypothetical protein BT93_K2494 [Corymbia citriodora subsp. variegata]